MAAADARLPVVALVRHRLETDGEGVTTLVGLHGCPLNCKYCLNPACRDPEGRFVWTDFAALYGTLAVDDLYFQATRGGVVFGGGEPLLYAERIAAFCEFCRERAGAGWRFWAETSLNVPEEALDALLPGLAGWIVDVKDADAATYHAYTGGEASRAHRNLARLLRGKDPGAVKVRVPLIPGFNTPEMNDATERAVRDMGAVIIDRFQYRIA